MHVNVLVVSDWKEWANADMNQYCGQVWDSYEILKDDVPKTVGDVRTMEHPEQKYWAIVDETVYRNPYNIMTPEQVNELYRRVLEPYDGDKPVFVFDVHI